jgi:hypothetical protein
MAAAINGIGEKADAIGIGQKASDQTASGIKPRITLRGVSLRALHRDRGARLARPRALQACGAPLARAQRHATRTRCRMAAAAATAACAE